MYITVEAKKGNFPHPQNADCNLRTCNSAICGTLSANCGHIKDCETISLRWSIIPLIPNAQSSKYYCEHNDNYAGDRSSSAIILCWPPLID